MAARTVVAPVGLSQDAGTSEGAGTTINSTLVTNGVTVASPGPWKILLAVYNSDSGSHSVIVRATGNGVTAAGATQTQPAPSGTVFAQSTLGDLTVVVTTLATYFIPVVTGSRFAQSDGSLSVDFSSGFTGTLWVFGLPGSAGWPARGVV